MGSCVTTATMPYYGALQLIVSEMDNNISGFCGLANMKSCIEFKDAIHLSCDFISEIVHAFILEALTLGNPDPRRQINKNPVGIHECWAGDGHDKLYPVGSPIWGVVDDVSSRWLGAWIMLDKHMGSVVASIFLSLIEDIGGDLFIQS
jgi:hypothetical protein